MFEAAVSNSPHKSCDVGIANAGIVGVDDLYQLQGEFCETEPPSPRRTNATDLDPSLPPVKTDLGIIEINLLGMA
jgi:hypothetical protein